MDERFSRSVALIGQAAADKLKKSKVIVFGAGGVGGYVIEGLARGGVGRIDVVDPDRIELSNFNRQILATEENLGKYKADAAVSRVASINPEAECRAVKTFYLPENADEINLAEYDYVVDAVDTVAAKTELAVRCFKKGINLISCMGTGNKLDPSAFRIADIFDTKVCPLCKAMRKTLKERNVTKLKVLYSEEKPVVSVRPPASISFCPAVAGMTIAACVMRELVLNNN